MTEPAIRTTRAVTAEDVLAVLATAAEGADRLGEAAHALAAPLSAWQATESALIGDLREQLRAARAQTADLSAARQRLQEDFARLRRAVRAHVLAAIDDGTLYHHRDEVDQAFRDWGMPGLPVICVVTVHARFATEVDASDAEQAGQRARAQFHQATARLDGCQIRVDYAELDPPAPQRGSARRRVTGRMGLAVTLRADDPQQAAQRALPMARDALSTLPGLGVDTHALTVTGAQNAGFDPDLDPDND
jgi:hypothetical protein